MIFNEGHSKQYQGLSLSISPCILQFFIARTSPRLADDSSESEVGYFDASLIGHQQIGNFQVPMDDVARVKILQSAENLEHDTFHLSFREGRSHVVQKRRDILFAITVEMRARDVGTEGGKKNTFETATKERRL